MSHWSVFCTESTLNSDLSVQLWSRGVESAKWFYTGFFLGERGGVIILSEADCVFVRMNSQTCSGANRFADYFVICGLDLSSGLEPDRFAGELRMLVVFDRLKFKDHSYLVTNFMEQSLSWVLIFTQHWSRYSQLEGLGFFYHVHNSPSILIVFLWDSA
jgi:hypothetical protein